MLKHGPFAASVFLEHVAKGGPVLKREGHRGPPVALIQGALIDLGSKLPNSVRITGIPDGIFGYETEKALKVFQADKGLTPDGIAGKKTIAALDQLMVMKAGVPQHLPPPPPPVPPRTQHYQLGSADPIVKADAGAGRWNSRPTMATYSALKMSIISILPEAAVVIGKDAAKHMAHYLENSGLPIRLISKAC